MKKKDNDNEIDYELLLFNSEGEDDVEVDYLSKITDTVTWSTDWTIESIVSAHKRSSFNVNPSFQRRDAWTDTKKSRFIESLIFGLPVPQIVLAEDKNQRGKYLVVDGKQRLITLFAFFSDDTNDRFKLTGLKSSKINGLDFAQLEQQHPDLYNNLLNQSIRSIIIKNWTTENLLYTIFFRLNSGSLPLSPQELRKALKPGEFLKKIDYYCIESTAIRFLFGEEVPDARMRDMDLLLRFFVITRFIEEYRGNYKNAVDHVCDFYNKSWPKSESEVSAYLEKFEQAIAKARTVFGDDEVFRRKSNSKIERRINRALFDIIIYYLTQIDEKDIEKYSSDIKRLTEDLTQSNPQFVKAISSNTNGLKETSTRFVLYGEGLQALSINVRIPQNLKDYYSKV